MKPSMLLMIFASVGLSASAQIALKSGMTDQKIGQLILRKDYFAVPISVAASPLILFGLFLFAASVAIWLAVLASVPLSVAYPFVSLGICLTAIAGSILFNEPITVYKALGVALIVSGILCISLSAI
jgi:multidrug transporter EmrE-like cation transporter